MSLHDDIIDAVRRESIKITGHAAMRLVQRDVPVWQVIGLIEEAVLHAERLDNEPDPAVELDLTLADGKVVRCVWALRMIDRTAILVTVHEL